MPRDRERERRHLREVLGMLQDPPANPRAEAEALERPGRRDALTRLKLAALAYLIETQRARPEAPEHDLIEWHRRLLQRAVRAGLADHPLVAAWLAVHKALGNRDALRASRPRYGPSPERGTRRPLSARATLQVGARRVELDEVALANAITACIDRGLERPADILRALQRRNLLPTHFTREQFRRLLRRLGL